MAWVLEAALEDIFVCGKATCLYVIAKMRDLLNKLSGKYFQHVVGKETHQKYRLVMTLLARDEVDVIEENILFHLDRGVDFIIATDNGSCDGTTEILAKYEKQGLLHLIHEPSRVLDQAAWVNRMGCLAFEKYQADLIFHCDADEFWYPRSGSLKCELLARPRADVLHANVVNILMRDRNGGEVFPEDAVYAAIKPYSKDLRQPRNVDNTSFLLFKYPSKVIYKLKKGYLPVVAGNHRIESDGKLPPFSERLSHDISVIHFPVRGMGQFARKAINGGVARENYEKSIALGVGTRGWHIKRWLELSRSGKLMEEYKRLNLSDRLAEELLATGVVSKKDERLLALMDFLITHRQKS